MGSNFLFPPLLSVSCPLIHRLICSERYCHARYSEVYRWTLLNYLPAPSQTQLSKTPSISCLITKSNTRKPFTGNLAGETTFLKIRYLCHMKQFLRIFCLYLFALSCLPCSDGEHGHEALSSGGETTVLAASQDCPSSHEHCTDFCSPLCTCACCGSIVLNLGLEMLSAQAAVTHNTLSFSYQSPFSAVHRQTLFRPPINKLG